MEKASPEDDTQPDALLRDTPVKAIVSRGREVWVDGIDRQCRGRSGGDTIQRINPRKERSGSTRTSKTKDDEESSCAPEIHEK